MKRIPRVAHRSAAWMVLLIVAGIGLSHPSVTSAKVPQGGRACCSVVSVNPANGFVTAKVNATGQQFQFTLTNRAQLTQLHMGQEIYVNFANKQVSLDGRNPAGQIVSAAPIDGIRAPAAPVDGIRAAAAPVDGARVPAATITAIDKMAGLASAKINATGQPFQFELNNPAQLNKLAVGQPIFVNLGARRVSLDGKTPAGTITPISSAPSAPVDGATTPTSDLATQGAHTQGSSQMNSTTSAASSAARQGTTCGPRANGSFPTKVKAKVASISITNLGVFLNSANPNHLPDLVPSVPGAWAECDIPAGSTCQASCPPVTLKVALGVENLWPYPANGTIHVVLQDMSGNVVRDWTVNGLAGKAAAYPGNYQIQLSFNCSGAESAAPAPSPNYRLQVSAPGTAELNSNNNELQIYIPAGAPISP
jgi:hypothetical protein